MKKVLILNRRAPYSTSVAEEALDLALLSSAFEHDIRLVFLDDGVFQLKREQTQPLLTQRDISLTYTALAEFGIEKIYVEQTSLAARGLTVTDLLIPVKLLSSQALGQLLATQDILLNF